MPARSGLCERGVADRRAAPVDQVDHAVGGRPASLQELQRVIGRERGGRGGLPEHRVAHQRGRGRQVAADRREVERADGEDEAFERPVLQPVPDARRGDRLLLVDPRHELDVEAEEVDQLGGGVDLGLVHRLRLVEHRRGDERRPPRAGEKLGRAQEHGGALLPRRPAPVLPGLGGRLDRLLHLGLAALVDVGEHVALAVRHHRLDEVAGAHLLRRRSRTGCRGARPPSRRGGACSASRSGEPGA